MSYTNLVEFSGRGGGKIGIELVGLYWLDRVVLVIRIKIITHLIVVSRITGVGAINRPSIAIALSNNL